MLLDTATGTFQAAKSIATTSNPNGVAAGDFNGDGKLDIVVADTNANVVSLLRGNGGGTFVAPTDDRAGVPDAPDRDRSR